MNIAFVFKYKLTRHYVVGKKIWYICMPKYRGSLFLGESKIACVYCFQHDAPNTISFLKYIKLRSDVCFQRSSMGQYVVEKLDFVYVTIYKRHLFFKEIRYVS